MAIAKVCRRFNLMLMLMMTLRQHSELYFVIFVALSALCLCVSVCVCPKLLFATSMEVSISVLQQSEKFFAPS